MTRKEISGQRKMEFVLSTVLLVCLSFIQVDGECVSDCAGLPDGDYQSCSSCGHYVSCSNERLYEYRPCPAQLVWDDERKRCEWNSTSCLYDLLVAESYAFRLTKIDPQTGQPSIYMEYPIVVVAITYSHQDGLVYFADIEDGTIYATADGSDPIAEYETGSSGYFEDALEGILDIAVDVSSQLIYYCDYPSSIKTISMVNGQINTIFDAQIAGLGSVEMTSVELDHVNRYVYFADAGSSPAIYRSGMNGQNIQPVVTEEISYPNSLALDERGGFMYWIDEDLELVARARLDGTEPSVIVTSPDIPLIFSLVLYGDFIYAASPDEGVVVKFTRDGNHVTTVGPTSLVVPTGMVLVRRSA